MRQHTVSIHDEECAIRNGVYILPTMHGLRGSPHVVAVCKFSGNVIRNDNRTWVISEMKKMKIEYTEVTV